MKSNLGAIIREEQETYLESLLAPRDSLLEEMEQYSALHRIPSSDPEVGQFLAIITRAIKARRSLEIGTAIGYGAILIARAMGETGKVISIDVSPERAQTASQFIERAGLKSRIEIVIGKALDVLPRLSPAFDLVYLDAVKEEYCDYLELVVPLLAPAGLIIADNVLWKGQVATGRLRSADQAASTAGLQEFNRRISSHPLLDSVILPFGDGLAVAVRNDQRSGRACQ